MRLIVGIHRPARKAGMNVDEEKSVNMEVAPMMDKNLMKRKMLFSHTPTMTTTTRITTKRMNLLKIGNGNLSQMIC